MALTTAEHAMSDNRNIKAISVFSDADKWEEEVITHNGKKKLVYRIHGSHGETYRTNKTACTCPDFTRRYRQIKAVSGAVSPHLSCKHMLAVRILAVLYRAHCANALS